MSIPSHIREKHDALLKAYQDFAHVCEVYRDEAEDIEATCSMVLACDGEVTAAAVGFMDQNIKALATALEYEEFKDHIYKGVALDFFKYKPNE